LVELSIPPRLQLPRGRSETSLGRGTCLYQTRGFPAMLTILGRTARLCDGIARRDFLRIGALGVGASCLTLPDILRAEAATRTSSPHKAVINIFRGGGPPHQDMWDIKPEAPNEIRGEFKPIATSVPGIQIGETFPRIARIMDKCVVIRS